MADSRLTVFVVRDDFQEPGRAISTVFRDACQDDLLEFFHADEGSGLHTSPASANRKAKIKTFQLSKEIRARQESPGYEFRENAFHIGENDQKSIGGLAYIHLGSKASIVHGELDRKCELVCIPVTPISMYDPTCRKQADQMSNNPVERLKESLCLQEAPSVFT